MSTIENEMPVKGSVQFIQHNLPGLDAGEYMLEVKQALSTQPDTPPVNRYFFAIAGERFSINPTDVDSVYPPNLGMGKYDNTLPHIVLRKQTLPWLRYPTLDAPEVLYPDGKTDCDIPTWLAVLLFDEEDIEMFKEFNPQVKTVSLADLFFKRPVQSGSQGYSCFFREPSLGPESDRAELVKHLDYGQNPEDRCQVIDVPIQLFQKIAPSVNDLCLLAHVRKVDITRKATQNGVPTSRDDLSKIAGTSDFALVLGNRLPKKGKRSFAHLVSLEGLAPFLPVDEACVDSPADVMLPKIVNESGISFDIAENGFIRLVSLFNWSFCSIGDGRDFERLLSGLSPKNPLESGVKDFSFGLPFSAPSSPDTPSLHEARNAMAMGYTALEHHTRDGGGSVSWYRGPLLPYPAAEARGLPTYSSADAATSFNPDTGMLDVSYASAWQLGKLLALQNKQFSVALSNWRRMNLRQVVSSMEKMSARQSLTAHQKSQKCETTQKSVRSILPLLDLFLPVSGDNDRKVKTNEKFVFRSNLHVTALSQLDKNSDLLGDPSIPPEIYTWVAKLKLLDGVPFNYLVPDERMLPPESIRLFHVDINWIHALIDGGLSIGRNVTRQNTSPEHAHDTAIKRPLLNRLDRHARGQRARTLSPSVQERDEPLTRLTGFLLRSEAVRGWPGMEVNGYAEDGSLIDIVRFERLAPTVLICLFEDKKSNALRQIELHEPAETLHFGVILQSINIRYNYAAGNNGVGSPSKDISQEVPFRGTGDNRVIRMFRLAKALIDPENNYSNYIQNISSDFDHLPSSEFAMQMLKGVGKVSFTFKSGAE